MNPRSAIWVTWLFAGTLLVFLLYSHIQLHEYGFDDAYIHFRVARNLVQTGTPYYNTNEIVKVSTSTGWIVFLAIIYKIATLFNLENNFPLVMSITNAVISFLGVLVYTKIITTSLGKELRPPSLFFFPIPIVAMFISSSIGLMETPLALVVAGAGLYLLLQTNPSGFLLLGLAAYLRLELTVLLLLTGLFTILYRQFRSHQVVGRIALGAGPLVFFDLYFFHTMLPHSVTAKSAVYDLDWFPQVIHILFNFLPTLPLRGSLIALGVSTTLFISIVLFTLFTALRELKGPLSVWPAIFCLWSLFIVGGYILGRAIIFDWYIALYTLPLYVACAMCSFTTNKPRNAVIQTLLSLVVLFSGLSVVRILYASVRDVSAFNQFEAGARVKAYLSVGNLLNEEYPGSTLLTAEIGGLGYSFDGKILDGAGLASPEALAFHPLKVTEQRARGDIGAIPPGYVKESNPDLIVFYDGHGQALMENEVLLQYEEILLPAYLPEDAINSDKTMIWGSRYLRIFIRNTLPKSDRIDALGYSRSA